jgi:hypothetical protein
MFKPGDRVKCVNAEDVLGVSVPLIVGLEYTVRKVDEHGDMYVFPEGTTRDGWFANRFELVEESKQSALSTQVGGSHYKDFAIQPAEFIHRNGIGFLEGNVIKYVTRYKAKNGLQDLEKARHYIELLIEMETKK